MPKLVFTVPGSGSAFAGTGLGKVSAFPSIKRAGGPVVPYAGYLLGTAYDNQILHDWSGNGRTLEIGGAPVPGLISTPVAKAYYYRTPFTGADILGLNNEMTIAVVSKFAKGVAGPMVSNRPAGSGAAYQEITSGGTNNFAASHDGTNVANAIIPAQATDQDTVFQLFAGTFTPTSSSLNRISTGKPLVSVSATKTTGAIATPNKYLFGSTGQNSSQITDEAMVVFYPRALTGAEVEDTLFPALADLFAAYGGSL